MASPDPRPELDDLLATATSREAWLPDDTKSGARFERVVIAGDRYVLKYQDPRDDWLLRATGGSGPPVRGAVAGRAAHRLPGELDHARGRGLVGTGWWAGGVSAGHHRPAVPSGPAVLGGAACSPRRPHGGAACCVLGLARRSGPDPARRPLPAVRPGHGRRRGRPSGSQRSCRR